MFRELFASIVGRRFRKAHRWDQQAGAEITKRLRELRHVEGLPQVETGIDGGIEIGVAPEAHIVTAGQKSCPKPAATPRVRGRK